MTNEFKTASNGEIKKTAQATGHAICNKIANKITPLPPPPPPKKKKKKKLRENNSETVINEHDKEIPRKRFVSLKERQEIIDELRLK